MPRTYHIGLSAPKGVDGDTLIIEARRSVDYLSCELWQYLGEHITTKRELHEARFDIMALVNRESGTYFSHVRVS